MILRAGIVVDAHDTVVVFVGEIAVVGSYHLGIPDVYQAFGFD